MRLKKKLLITGVLCAVVLVGVFGGVAIASADDEDTAPAGLVEKVAAIYEQNTGTAIDAQELLKAFEEAGATLRTEMRDQFLQKLVDDGKITQEQADAWEAWLDARPDKAVTDEYQSWMESRPDLPEFFGSGGSGMMLFRMHRGLADGEGFGFRFHNCLPGGNIEE
jgi:hypothetical protein